jgi:hypothetical protein
MDENEFVITKQQMRDFVNDLENRASGLYFQSGMEPALIASVFRELAIQLRESFQLQ